jgi:hypothetical protein
MPWIGCRTSNAQPHTPGRLHDGWPAAAGVCRCQLTQRCVLVSSCAVALKVALIIVRVPLCCTR